MVLRMNLIEQAKHEEQVRASFEVAGVGRFSLGRDPNCDWVLPDPTRSISARHCEIVSDGASYTLRDLSTNGVFLNSASERLDHAHKLRDGDVFTLGRYIVKAWLADGANSARDASAPPLAARRGGDPAAMLAQPDRPISGQSPDQAGCVDTGMTMIRPPPRNVAAPAPSPAPPLDASSSRPEPASPAAPPAVTDVWERAAGQPDRIKASQARGD